MLQKFQRLQYVKYKLNIRFHGTEFLRHKRNVSGRKALKENSY